MKLTFGSPECGGGAQRENVWNQNHPTNTLSSPLKAEVSKTEFQASSGMSFWCLTIRPHNPSTLFMLLDLKTNVSGNHLPHGSSVTGPVYLTSCIREIINLGINKILSMNLLFCSVQSLSHVWLFATPWTAALQASLSITSSQSCSNSCLLSRWCHPTISSSVVPFSSCLQSFPASGSFPVRQLFASGGQSIEASAWASLLPVYIQGWFPLGLTGLISLQSKGLSRVFSSTIWKHQFFSAQPSVWSNAHICTMTTRKWLYRALSAKWCLCFLIHGV